MRISIWVGSSVLMHLCLWAGKNGSPSARHLTGNHAGFNVIIAYHDYPRDDATWVPYQVFLLDVPPVIVWAEILPCPKGTKCYLSCSLNFCFHSHLFWVNPPIFILCLRKSPSADCGQIHRLGGIVLGGWLSSGGERLVSRITTGITSRRYF